MNYSITAPSRIEAEINLPASKSISNRVLIINALCGGNCHISNIAECDDTASMLSALASESNLINIGAAGTAMRFLTSYFSLCTGRTVVLDGTERMRHRPIKTLVDTLNACGADIVYKNEAGFPPIEIHGRQYECGSISIASNVSSQFISAILMIMPVIGCRRLHLDGAVISRPYIEMTLDVMKSFGVESTFEDADIILKDGARYKSPDEYKVENDWSAASYWYAIQSLIPKSRISLRGLFKDSIQGDSRVAEFFRKLGVGSYSCGSYVDLHSESCSIGSLELDLSGNPDLAQTIIVAACLLNKQFHITGLQTLKIKETDRLEALRTQLLKLGYVVKIENDEAMSWNGETIEPEERPVIDTFDDHRMAMAFAPAAVNFPGLVIADVGVVGKSYPEFWKHLSGCGFVLKEVKL